MEAKKELKAVENYGKNIAVSIDQTAGSFIPGSYSDETISNLCIFV